MNTRKAIGYIFLGCGTISLIIAALLFISIVAVAPQPPFIGLELSPFALNACIPYLILATITFVIGGVTYCNGREKQTTPVMSTKKAEIKPNTALDRLKRLEEIDDKNFKIFVRSLDELEQKQSITSQSRHAKDKKE